jgi:hypothetical protein
MLQSCTAQAVQPTTTVAEKASARPSLSMSACESESEDETIHDTIYRNLEEPKASPPHFLTMGRGEAQTHPGSKGGRTATRKGPKPLPRSSNSAYTAKTVPRVSGTFTLSSTAWPPGARARFNTAGAIFGVRPRCSAGKTKRRRGQKRAPKAARRRRGRGVAGTRHGRTGRGSHATGGAPPPPPPSY